MASACRVVGRFRKSSPHPAPASAGRRRACRPFARRLIPCSSFCHVPVRTTDPHRRRLSQEPWSRVVASTAVVDRWAGGGPSLRPLALIDATAHTFAPATRQLSLALYELRVYSHVPSRAVPRNRPPQLPAHHSPRPISSPKSRPFPSPRPPTAIGACGGGTSPTMYRSWTSFMR